MWIGATKAARKFGWRIASAKMEKLFIKLWNVFEDDKEAVLSLGINGFCIDTHPRSGEFTELIRDNIDEIKKKASRRLIWMIPDPNEEWTRVCLLYGSEKRVLAILRAKLARSRITVEIEKNCVRMIKGKDVFTYKSDDPKILMHEVYSFMQGAVMPTAAGIITDIIEVKAGLADEGLFSWTENVLNDDIVRLAFDHSGNCVRVQKTTKEE